MRDDAGIAAVEFALLLPVMVLLYLGTYDLGNALAVQFKVTRAARTLADLASRYTSIDTSTMSAILNAGFPIVAPYSSSNMSVVVSEITTNSQGAATVTWSCALRGGAHTFGSNATLPSGVGANSISILWGEVSYPYTPSYSYSLTGPITIKQKFYFYPRMASSVTGPSTFSSCPTS